MDRNKITKCLILIMLMGRMSNAQLMGMNPIDLVNAYVDAGIENFKSVLDGHSNHSYGQFDSEKCFQQIKYFKTQAKSTQMWALKVIDSWSKIPSGIASGNIRDLGSYDQCLEVEQKSDDNAIGTFRGQFCVTPLNLIIDETTSQNKELTKLSSVLNVTNAYMSLCIPDTCSPEAWEDIVNSLLNKYHVKVGKNMNRLCQNNTKKPMDNLDIISLTFFLTILFIIIISTCVEYILMSKGLDASSSFWTIFSIYSNGKELFKLKKKKPTDSDVECIHGIRSLSLFWIVLFHSYTKMEKVPMVNPTFVLKWLNSIYAVFVVHGIFVVDTFFVIGGFVLCWNQLRELDRSKGKINFLLKIIKRYMRMVPSLMAFILFITTLLKYMGSGPIWNNFLSEYLEPCVKYWWKNFFFYQNYTEYCAEETWYLAVDFHLFCVSIFLIYGVWKWGNKFFWVLLLPVIVACSIQFYKIIVNDFRLTDLSEKKVLAYLHLVYRPTEIRMSPYFIGTLLALFMYKNRDNKLNMTKVKAAFIWVLSFFAFWISYFCIDDFMHNPHGIYKSALYQIFLRVLWSLNISWIIFACHHGMGGPINKFLTYKLWQPIARLSFNIYIIHMTVIIYFFAKSQMPFYFDDLYVARQYFGNLVVSIIVAIIWTLAFEQPFCRLFDHFTKSDRKKIVPKLALNDLGEGKV